MNNPNDDVGLVIPAGWTPCDPTVELEEDLLVQFLNPDGTATAPVELPAGSQIEHPRQAVRFWRVVPGPPGGPPG